MEEGVTEQHVGRLREQRTKKLYQGREQKSSGPGATSPSLGKTPDNVPRDLVSQYADRRLRPPARSRRRTTCSARGCMNGLRRGGSSPGDTRYPTGRPPAS